MTEDEAKTKWCPHARVGNGGNRDTIPSATAYFCRASACMAWRWKFRDTTSDHHPMMAVYPQPKRTYERTEDGYCGLAGAPA